MRVGWGLGVATWLFLLAGPAQAWGPRGHAIVAAIAEHHLTPAARAEMLRLLAPEHAAHLADVASWADEIQDAPRYSALWRQTRRQHYVNFADARCRYQPIRDCADGQCAVAGLAHYVAVLSAPAQGDKARREALKFVVHFVGDIHQPLHAGYRDDKGGNAYQVRFRGRGSNLHRVWDSGLIGERRLGAAAYARRLDAAAPAAHITLPQSMDTAFVDWAQASCRLTARAGFYPSGHVVTRDYVAASLPVAEARLRLAGLRLAAVLNQALVPPAVRPGTPPSGRAMASATLGR